MCISVWLYFSLHVAACSGESPFLIAIEYYIKLTCHSLPIFLLMGTWVVSSIVTNRAILNILSMCANVYKYLFLKNSRTGTLFERQSQKTLVKE